MRSTYNSIAQARKELPDFLQNKFDEFTSKVLKTAISLNRLVPDAQIQPMILHVVKETDTTYLDDGNTPCPGTLLRCVWQFPVGTEKPTEYFDWYRGNGSRSIWFSAEFRFRNSDNRPAKDNFPSLCIGKWGEFKQERIWYSPFGTFNLGFSDISNAVEKLGEIVARTKLENRVNLELSEMEKFEKDFPGVFANAQGLALTGKP